MKITRISRKVSGYHYSNIELTADLEENDNPEEVALELNRKCNEYLKAMQMNEAEQSEQEQNKNDMLSKIDALKKAIEKNEVSELPF